MNKEQFIHELKDIIQIQGALKYNRDRLTSIEDKLIERTNILLDLATEHYDGGLNEEK